MSRSSQGSSSSRPRTAPRWPGLFASLLLVAGAPALADHDEEDFSGPAAYLGFSALGAAYTQIDEELEDALFGAAHVETETAAGFEVYAGYRFHPHLALEAEFEFFPEAEIDAEGFGTFATLESWTAMGNLKAFLLTGRVQPYLLVGAGGMQAEIEDTLGLGARERDFEFALQIGSGLEFYINEHFALSLGAGYVFPTGDLDALDRVSFGAGLLFRFPVDD